MKVPPTIFLQNVGRVLNGWIAGLITGFHGRLEPFTHKRTFRSICEMFNVNANIVFVAAGGIWWDIRYLDMECRVDPTTTMRSTARKLSRGSLTEFMLQLLCGLMMSPVHCECATECRILLATSQCQVASGVKLEPHEHRSVSLSLKQGSFPQTSTFVAAVLRLAHTIYSTTTELISCQMCHVERSCMPLVLRQWR